MLRTKRFVCCLLAALLILALCPLSVFAAGGIDVNAETSLTIKYLYEGTPIPGARFRVYRLADVDADANFTLSGSFAGYNVRVNSNTVEEWNTLAETLSAYVNANSETPDRSGYTDVNGELAFGGLDTGLYLVVGDKAVSGLYTYTARPAIVCLPGYDEENDSWNYDVTAYPKVRRDTAHFDPIRREAHKIWDDNGDKTKRPEYIKVQLYADGVPYGEPVKLNADNGWSYTWEGLPPCDANGAKIVWTVTEEKVEGYTVKIVQQGITFTITNSTSNTPPPGPPDLPQTGMLWWPVPALLFSGMLLTGMGISRRRRDTE